MGAGRVRLHADAVDGDAELLDAQLRHVLPYAGQHLPPELHVQASGPDAARAEYTHVAVPIAICAGGGDRSVRVVRVNEFRL